MSFSESNSISANEEQFLSWEGTPHLRIPKEIIPQIIRSSSYSFSSSISNRKENHCHDGISYGNPEMKLPELDERGPYKYNSKDFALLPKLMSGNLFNLINELNIKKESNSFIFSCRCINNKNQSSISSSSSFSERRCEELEERLPKLDERGPFKYSSKDYALLPKLKGGNLFYLIKEINEEKESNLIISSSDCINNNSVSQGLDSSLTNQSGLGKSENESSLFFDNSYILNKVECIKEEFLDDYVNTISFILNEEQVDQDINEILLILH